jgi:hypothetical protein
MKPPVYVWILVSILGLNSLCYAQTENTHTSIEEVKKETRDLLKTINSYTADKKDEAVKKAKDGLDRLDKRERAKESA